VSHSAAFLATFLGGQIFRRQKLSEMLCAKIPVRQSSAEIQLGIELPRADLRKCAALPLFVRVKTGPRTVAGVSSMGRNCPGAMYPSA